MAFLSLLVAHFIGDFYFQTDKMVKNKKKYFKVHLFHQFLIVFTTLFILFFFIEENDFGLYVILPTILFTVFHGIIDWGKILGQEKLEEKYGKASSWEGSLFIIDQILHIVSIVIIAIIVFDFNFQLVINNVLISLHLAEGTGQSFSTEEKVLFLFIMLIISTTVTGHLIRIMLGSFTNYLALFEGKYRMENKQGGRGFTNKDLDQTTSLSEEYTYMVVKQQDLSRGKIIGYLERLLVIILVVADSISSIAFIIAAKSLTRFKQLDDRDWAEYFLLGTLSSILLAIFYGFIIKLLVF
ncbi:DUF3307 domain-containing protein [Evansella sp. AB-P1]|uniref:DUF3307 domain-containing protein n=1 Tax=Evansella sp. AB-P1 TaxID=3037653 RepID=UPI00241CD59F|nr:DUF3307 domain-containing protein [Evansella sp. AB-P1]MDG5788598.1 DUF3307 domain-containing protein [Evansella sp. AB-P1]